MFLVKTIDETLKIISNNFYDYKLNIKTIALDDALNYVSAEDIISNEDVPHFNRSIVDGYAVDFDSVKLASATSPSILKLKGNVLMGTEYIYNVNSDTTVYVPTGGHLPKGSNAVVMIENTDTLGEEIVISKSVSVNENVLLRGTDISKGQYIISKNTKITPLIIGSLKAIGVTRINVYEKLSASVISTGDEIVKNKKTLNIGEIRDINTYTISNYLRNKNIIVNNSLIINDNFTKYKNEVLKGFESSDIVISSGGSSVGDKDYTLAVLNDIGAEILVHGINIKPGKPSIIAKYNNKLFLGLPGQPTSAFFVLNTLINEILNTIYSLTSVMPTPYFEARLDLNIHSSTGRRMYQLVNIRKEKSEYIASPLFSKSGMIYSLSKACGYIIVDESSEGYNKGSIVKVYRLGDWHMERNVYLKSTDLKEISPVIDLLFKNYILKYEVIKVVDSLNRISFEAIYAQVSSPYYSSSAMDGIALKASSTYGASEVKPVRIDKKNIIYVNTGNEIPDKYDAVVMIEDVYDNDDGTISLIQSVKPYQDIRPIGEDIVEGDMVIPKNHLIRPVDISALLSAGISHIRVIKKPQVAIIPTGDEIIREVKDLKKGKIIDSNSFFMKNELAILGAESKIFDVVVDEYSLLEKAIVTASKSYDLVLIGAGSSAGSKDYAKSIIEKNGRVYVHGISIKPGKPTIIGQMNNTPIIGVPGYPVSTFIAFEIVVKPIIRKFLKLDKNKNKVIQAKLTKKIYSSLKNEEFIRVKLGIINNQYVATPLDRGAGVTMSLVKADGLMIIPKNCEGYEANTIVDVSLLKDIEEIERSLISIGSHDILLDKIDDLMSNNNFHLSSSHIGSFGGIMAIKSKGCHIAPVHVLDDDGTYNVNLIDKYLDSEYSLVRGVSRVQGLMVKKGNPKNIKRLDDLLHTNITFVNRQRGSGTRILLDYLLNKEGIDPKRIKGYDFELSTHMLVASSVKDPRFDCGMGIVSVANLNNLDIVEIGEENYDFLVLKEIIDTPIFNEFIAVLKSKDFKDELDKLGGYIIKDIGVIIK